MKIKLPAKSIIVILLAALSLGVAFLLSGCNNIVEYDLKDAKEYLKEKGITEFTISEEQHEITTEEKGAEMAWDVETDFFGFDEPIKFHVIDRHFSGKFGTSNSLVDDHVNAIRERIRDTYQPAGDLSYTSSVKDHGFFTYPLRGREDFINAHKEIIAFQDYLSNYPNLKDYSFSLGFELPRAEDGRGDAESFLRTGSYNLSIKADYPPRDEGDYLKILMEGSNEDVRGIVSEYLESCMELGLLDRVDEFTQEEIDWCIEDSHRKGATGLVRVRDRDMKVIDEKAVYGRRIKTISYGNVYRLAKTLGCEVTGDWWDFSIQGPDGETYSYAYKDIDDNYDGPLVNVEEVSKALGIQLDDGQPVAEIVFDKDKLALLEMTAEELKEYVLSNSQLDEEKVIALRDLVTIKAKQEELLDIVEANEKTMEEIAEQLKAVDPEFHASFGQVRGNVHTELHLTTSKDEKVLKAEEEKIKRLMALAWFNCALFHTDSSRKIGVSLYHAEKGTYETRAVFQDRYEFPE